MIAQRVKEFAAGGVPVIEEKRTRPAKLADTRAAALCGGRMITIQRGSITS
ncbi:MAG: hypothetical protein ACREON_06490 [Gemmatimonadaceae bacterium]